MKRNLISTDWNTYFYDYKTITMADGSHPEKYIVRMEQVRLTEDGWKIRVLHDTGTGLAPIDPVAVSPEIGRILFNKAKKR
jgi:recombinational DNA repair protein (RecF pathway)